MNDFLAQFGVKGEDIAPHTETVKYPKPTQGRVAHIDADFLAYMVSAESKDELEGNVPRKSFEDMQNNAREAVKHLTAMAGATSYACHLTPSASTKGGRDQQAVQQEYQANRKGREKPEFLDAIRAFIGQELNGIPHLDQEADDGLAQANYNAQGPDGQWGKSNLSIIISKDKDLRMVPGLHMDWMTGKHHCTGSPFGSIYMDESTKTRKLSGWGTKFFWAQCLMGDSADNIRGAPGLPGRMKIEVAPTKTYTDLMRRWADELDPEKAAKIEAKIDAILNKSGKCGPVATFDLLKDCHSDKECYEVVKNTFTRLHTEHGYEFTHWRTGQVVTPTQALLGDMQLLWMRRNKNPLDVVDWIKEVLT